MRCVSLLLLPVVYLSCMTIMIRRSLLLWDDGVRRVLVPCCACVLVCRCCKGYRHGLRITSAADS